MTRAAVRRTAGFTLFEFGIVVLVFGLLAGALLARADAYAQDAERAAVDNLVGAMRSALQLRSGVAHGEGLRQLAEGNPLDLLERRPTNYVGEYYSPELENIPGGNWVFDRRDKSLIYLLNNHESFPSYTSKFLKFKVESVYAPVPGGKIEPATPRGGMALVEISGPAAVDSND